MKIIAIGKRMIAIDHITLVEPFDPNANREFRIDRDFKSRIVMRNRDTVLIEESPAEFAGTHGLLLLADDQVALNVAFVFKIEAFEPTEQFQPNKPFRTRLKWDDGFGNDHSKLLLTAPEAVINALHGDRAAKRPPGRPRRKADGADSSDTSRT